MFRDFQASLSAARASPDSATVVERAVVKDLMMGEVKEGKTGLQNGM